MGNMGTAVYLDGPGYVYLFLFQSQTQQAGVRKAVGCRL
jgi:hypothetical protein